MGKRTQRAKPLSPQQAMVKTLEIVTPQQGQEIRSFPIKYKHLTDGSKLKEHVADYLVMLGSYHMARYKLQQSGYRLQTILDFPLTTPVPGEEPKLSKSKHWKFKLTNKEYAKKEVTLPDGTKATETYIFAADLHCYDTPAEDFTKKLPSYLPTEQAASLGLGVPDLGDINEPQNGDAEGTDDDTDDDTIVTVQGVHVGVPGVGDKYRPDPKATDPEAKHWYEMNAKDGLPQDWQKRPGVELNKGGKARAKKHKWVPT